MCCKVGVLMLDICLLGCGGSMPTPTRFLTSLLFQYQGKKVLVDCGEGTQVSMKLLGWGFKSIDIICITHVHGDHIIGLPGLLMTIGNSNRTAPITLIGPKGFKEIMLHLMVLCPYLPYDIHIIEVSDLYEQKINNLIDNLSISTLPVEHTAPTVAYSFIIDRTPKFDAQKAKANQIPMTLWNRLQKGESIHYENHYYTPDMVLGDPRRGIKLSYCTDTRPIPQLPPFVQHADLFICEGMYGSNDEIEKAVSKKHMIFREAADIAKKADVKELWLTHFSPSLSDPDLYLQNAAEIFPNTQLGFDRRITQLHFL